MVAPIDPTEIRAGSDVFAADGEKIGTVSGVELETVVVEEGMFFPASYAVPLSAIASVDDDRITLRVDKDAVLAEEWGAAATTTAATTETEAVVGMGATGASSVAADPGGMTEDVGAAFAHRQDSDRTHQNTEEGLRVEIHEEGLTATTRPREIGEVLIEKEIVTEDRTIEVPVTEERLRVARHAVDRPPADGDTPFDGGKIAIPIMGEAVELQTEVRIAEEVEIGKETVERTEQVTGTVRREEVRVTESGDATVIGDGAPTERPTRTE